MSIASLLGQLFVPCLAITLSGCVFRLGDLTALSSKNVPLKFDRGSAVRGEGKDCRYVVVGIPLGYPSLEQAMDRAIGNRGNALVNEVTHETGWSALVIGQVCYKVEGDVVTLQ